MLLCQGLHGEEHCWIIARRASPLIFVRRLVPGHIPQCPRLAIPFTSPQRMQHLSGLEDGTAAVISLHLHGGCGARSFRHSGLPGLRRGGRRFEGRIAQPSEGQLEGPGLPSGDIEGRHIGGRHGPQNRERRIVLFAQRFCRLSVEPIPGFPGRQRSNNSSVSLMLVKCITSLRARVRMSNSPSPHGEETQCAPKRE